MSWPCEERSIARLEYEINDVGIPGVDLDDDRNVFLPTIAARARRFASTILQSAFESYPNQELMAVVSIGVDEEYLTHGTTVKFFTLRGDYPDWFDNLEGFRSEAMLLLRAVDAEGVSE